MIVYLKIYLIKPLNNYLTAEIKIWSFYVFSELAVKIPLKYSWKFHMGIILFNISHLN